MDRTHSRDNRSLVGGLLVLITFICASLLMAPSASAHTGGLFQPAVRDLVVEGDGTDAGRTVWVRILDADSGKPAFGLRAFITAGGTSTPLTEVAAGYYAGPVNLPEGPVALGLNLRSAPGGELIAKFAKSFNITVPPANQRVVVQGRGESEGLAAAQASSLHQERLNAVEHGKGLNVRLEQFQDDTLVSPLWVRIHVFVEDRATAKLDPTEYEVYGYAVDAQGNETEFGRFSPLDAIDRQYQPGTYGGVIILPHGGQWSMKANVLSLRHEMKGPPVFITSGELLIEREGAPAAQGGGGAPAARSAADQLAESRAKANVSDLTLLIIHTLAAGAWGLITGLFLLLAFQRARALSTWARNIMERNLDVLVRAAYVTTAAVIGTGIWNIYREAPYGMPGSFGELSDFMDLPFGRAYYLSLGGKLLAYSVLLYGSFRLIHSSRAELRASGRRHRPAAETGNPWLKRRPGDPVPEMAAAGGARQPWSRPVTEQPAMSMTVVLEAEAPAGARTEETVQAAPASTRSRFRMALLPVMAVSTLALVVCIAILKYAHLLIEVARLS